MGECFVLIQFVIPVTPLLQIIFCVGVPVCQECMMGTNGRRRDPPSPVVLRLQRAQQRLIIELLLQVRYDVLSGRVCKFQMNLPEGV